MVGERRHFVESRRVEVANYLAGVFLMVGFLLTPFVATWIVGAVMHRLTGLNPANTARVLAATLTGVAFALLAALQQLPWTIRVEVFGLALLLAYTSVGPWSVVVAFWIRGRRAKAEAEEGVGFSSG